ncbi:hypothetical protein RTBOTA2_000109, partial [Rhodotorula toruloides]
KTRKSSTAGKRWLKGRNRWNEAGLGSSRKNPGSMLNVQPSIVKRQMKTCIGRVVRGKRPQRRRTAILSVRRAGPRACRTRIHSSIKRRSVATLASFLPSNSPGNTTTSSFTVSSIATSGSARPSQRRQTSLHGPRNSATRG